MSDASGNWVSANGGSLMGSPTLPNTAGWSNVFVVSTEVLNKSKVEGEWVTNMDGVNLKPDGGTSSIYKSGVYRYETEAALKTAQASVFGDFDSNYWQVNKTTGYLEFISAVK